MDGIRRSLVRGERMVTIDEHQALLSTSLFERIIRLLRRLQTTIAAGARN